MLTYSTWTSNNTLRPSDDRRMKVLNFGAVKSDCKSSGHLQLQKPFGTAGKTGGSISSLYSNVISH